MNEQSTTAAASPVPWNLADLWELTTDQYPDREALVVGEQRVSYRQIEERANALAHVLTDAGVGPGDHVACYLQNCAEYVETMLAAFKIRAVPLNVNYRYVAAELSHLLRDGDAVAVVFHRRFSDSLAEVAPGRVAGWAGYVVGVPWALALDQVDHVDQCQRSDGDGRLLVNLARTHTNHGK